jgi:hypothetical protein
MYDAKTLGRAMKILGTAIGAYLGRSAATAS